MPAGKPPELGGQGEQPRWNRVGDPRHLPLAATETRGNPDPPAAALWREEREAERLIEARAPPGARNP